MVCVGTPARSLSSVRSSISEGGVSSINWTNGSMASENWTRCGMGMVSFSLSAVMSASLPLLVPSPAGLNGRDRAAGGLLHFRVIVPRDLQTVNSVGRIRDMRQRPPSSAFHVERAAAALPCGCYRVAPGLRHHGPDEKG